MVGLRLPLITLCKRGTRCPEMAGHPVALDFHRIGLGVELPVVQGGPNIRSLGSVSGRLVLGIRPPTIAFVG